MKIDELVDQLKIQKLLILPLENLSEILKQVTVIEDKDTLMIDHIRILKWKEKILIQEATSKNELAIRIAESVEDANRFINERMETYERMWDGCGCKVNYYD